MVFFQASFSLTSATSDTADHNFLLDALACACVGPQPPALGSARRHTVCPGGSFSSSSFKMLAFPTFWLVSLIHANSLSCHLYAGDSHMCITGQVFLLPSGNTFLPLGTLKTLPKLNSLFFFPKNLAISPSILIFHISVHKIVLLVTWFQNCGFTFDDSSLPPLTRRF